MNMDVRAHLMGGSSLPLLRAAQSMLRSHGWLLMSFTPDTRQPYLLLRSVWTFGPRTF